jgi:SAM-dependent methyltransferase
VIDTARSLRDPSLQSLTFEVGSIYAPPFAPGSFDAAFAHQVLQHLARPVDALAQMRNLLKPGGVVGVREVDWGSATFYPDNDGMRRFLHLYYELAHRNGGEPNAGRHMRRWFREAGFVETRITTSTTSYTDSAATREWANTYAERTLHSNIADKALEYGIANVRTWRAWPPAGAWGDHPTRSTASPTPRSSVEAAVGRKRRQPYCADPMEICLIRTVRRNRADIPRKQC